MKGYCKLKALTVGTFEAEHPFKSGTRSTFLTSKKYGKHPGPFHTLEFLPGYRKNLENVVT